MERDLKRFIPHNNISQITNRRFSTSTEEQSFSSGKNIRKYYSNYSPGKVLCSVLRQKTLYSLPRSHKGVNAVNCQGI